MNEIALFNELCGLLVARGIEIRTERFLSPPDSAGGLCQLAGKHLVLLHSGASKAERARALLEVVEQIGLEELGIRGVELSPDLLSRLHQRGQLPWPHSSPAPPLAKPLASGTPHRHLKLIMSPPPLSQHTTIGLGGSPTRFETVRSEPELLELVRGCKAQRQPLYILGGGSNVVVADRGVEGTVAKMALRGITVHELRGKLLVTAAAGEGWHDFVSAMTAENRGGLECLGGIPGSVGATPIQNVGAYGQEVSQTISKVRVLNRKTLKFRELSNKECRFSYRSSLFKNKALDLYVVVSVTFELQLGAKPSLKYGELQKELDANASLQDTLAKVLELRRSKSMLYDTSDSNHRSCGSFFVNPQLTQDEFTQLESRLVVPVPTFAGDEGRVKVPAAWLIERAGFSKGMRSGSVGLSTKHALCVVAHSGATTDELIDFARHIRDTVLEKTGVGISPEPNFWGIASPTADPLLNN